MTLLVVWAAAAALFAQNAAQFRIASPKAPADLIQAAKPFNGPLPLRTVSKTAAVDTLSAHRYITYENGQLRIGEQTTLDCIITSRYLEEFQGYVSGTTGPLPIYVTRPGGERDTVNAVLAEHGLYISTPLDLESRGIYVHKFMVFFAQGRQNGAPDTYHVRMYPVQGSQLNPNEPSLEVPFNFSEFPEVGEGGLVEIEPLYNFDGQGPQTSDLMRGRYLVTIEVNTENGDDSLNLYYTSTDCNRTAPVDGAVIIKDIDNGFAPIGINSLTGLFGVSPETNFFEAPFIVPIVLLDDKFVGRPGQKLMESNGLTLYDVYPNPAVDHVHLKFDLAHNDQVEISVIDNLGRVVLKTEPFAAAAGQTVRELNVSELPCGNYSYIVKTTAGGLGGRLLIER